MDGTSYGAVTGIGDFAAGCLAGALVVGIVLGIGLLVSYRPRAELELIESAWDRYDREAAEGRAGGLGPMWKPGGRDLRKASWLRRHFEL